jgi:hypothetical protein
LKRLLQVPRSEIMEVVNKKYNIHSAFGVVLSTVIEQVAHFNLSEYPDDGRGEIELDFEKHLRYDRRGGFVLLGDEGANVADVWWKRMESLAGPKLLDRGQAVSDDADEDEVPKAKSTIPSFRSDRRIVRLLIARYWADLLQKRYETHLESLNPQQEEK